MANTLRLSLHLCFCLCLPLSLCSLSPPPAESLAPYERAETVATEVTSAPHGLPSSASPELWELWKARAEESLSVVCACEGGAQKEGRF